MSDLRCVLVAGAGLLGTSVGLALTRAGLRVHLRDTLPGRAEQAAQLGAGTATAPTGPVDLAVVATPPGAVAATLFELQQQRAAAAYTDVASVKARPLAELEARGGTLATYVGGHPLAGSERSGPQAARSDLFEGRPWVLCPTPATEPAAVARLRELVEHCGAVPVVMGAGLHDEAVAVVSHVPHVLASLAAARLADAQDSQVAVAGPGVRDVTRVAAGDPRLWIEILRDNAGPVLAQLQAVRADLDTLIAGLAGLRDDAAQDARDEAAAAVATVLARGVSGRARIPGKHGGPATHYASVAVVVPDRPGELARLFADCGAAGVNIEDLRIEHSPGQPVGLAEIMVKPDTAAMVTAELRARGWTVQS